MCEERIKTRCRRCELVQWADHANCLRCGQLLPAPIVNVVERVVEKVVFERDSQFLENLQEASKLISAAAARLEHSNTDQRLPVDFSSVSAVEEFPTLDEMERAMIVAAYRRCNRKPLEAARILGIERKTLYRKLERMEQP